MSVEMINLIFLFNTMILFTWNFVLRKSNNELKKVYLIKDGALMQEVMNKQEKLLMSYNHEISKRIIIIDVVITVLLFLCIFSTVFLPVIFIYQKIILFSHFILVIFILIYMIKLVKSYQKLKIFYKND